MVPILGDAGWAIENPAPWALGDALLPGHLASLLCAIFIGPVVVPIDIRESVRALEERSVSDLGARERTSSGQRIPFLTRDDRPPRLARPMEHDGFAAA